MIPALPSTVLQSAIERITEWTMLAVFLLVPGAIATLMCSPFLLAGRIRSLFASLPPSDSPLPSYVIVGLAASVPYLVGLSLIGATVPSTGAHWSNAIINLAVVAGVAYTVAAPVVGVVLLPRVGVDWDPTGYRVSTWLLLAVGGASYALLFAIPLVAVAVLFALPGGY